MAEESDGSSSLRNLPPGKMKDIRHMFESDDDNLKKEITPLMRKKVLKPAPPRPLTSVLHAQNDSQEDNCRTKSESYIKPPQHKPRKPSIVSETIKQMEEQTVTAKEDGAIYKPPQSDKGTPKKVRKQKVNDSVPNSENHISNSKEKEKSNYEKNETSAYAKPHLPQKPKVKLKAETVKDGEHSEQSILPPCTDSKNQVPAAPKKPPRTHAHDEYLMTKAKVQAPKKVERTKQDGKKTVTEIENMKLNKEKPRKEGSDLQTAKKGAPVYKRIEHAKLKDDIKLKSEMETIVPAKVRQRRDSGNRPDKPNRPPPPRPRPYSVATDTFKVSSLLTESHSRDKPSKLQRPELPQRVGDGDSGESEDMPLYEQVTPIGNKKKGSVDTRIPAGMPDLVLDHRAGSSEFDLQHWDLPRDTIRFPLRRSMSAECVSGEKSISGDPIYLDPTEAIGYHDDSEVYIDCAGYAVPYKHRRVQHMQSYDSSMVSMSMGL